MADEHKYDFRCSGKVDGKKYRLLMTGEIARGNSNAGAEVLAALERMPKGSDLEIQLRDFYGGDVYEGLTVYHGIKDLGATVLVDGVVASMATVIMLAGAKVIATKRSKGMTHRPEGGAEGTSDILQGVSVRLEAAEKELAELYAERTGKTVEEAIAAFMPPGKPVWFTAAQMKDIGLVDEVVAGTSTRTVPMADVRKLSDADAILGRFRAVLDEDEVDALTPALTPDPSPKERGVDEKPSPETAKTKAMKKEITAKLGLAEGADDATVEQAVENLTARAEKAEKALEARDKSDADAAEAEANGLIEAALKEDRIGKPQAEAMKAEVKKAPLMAMGIVKHTLGAMPAHKALHGSLNVLKPGQKSLVDTVVARADWSYNRWSKEDSKGLARLRDEAPELFKQVRENLG